MQRPINLRLLRRSRRLLHLHHLHNRLHRHRLRNHHPHSRRRRLIGQCQSSYIKKEVSHGKTYHHSSHQQLHRIPKK